MVLVDYIWIFLTFSRWLYFVWSSFLVAIKDRSFDLFIQDDKKNSIYLRIQINHAAFICVQFIGARKWKKSRSILLLSLVHLHLLQGNAGDRESVLQGEQWEVPLKNACTYYFFHMPLLFCCMILFLSFVVTPVLTLPSPCNLLFVCNIPSNV